MKPGSLFDLRGLRHLHGDQRNQADERADLQRNLPPVRRLELVVIKAVLFVPQAGAAEGVHGVGNVDEMFEELRGDVLVRRIRLGQLQGHGEHRQAIERHPRGAVGLLREAAVGQRLGSVEDADVIETEKAAGEQIVAFVTSLRFTHQVKLSSSFWKALSRKADRALRERPVIL